VQAPIRAVPPQTPLEQALALQARLDEPTARGVARAVSRAVSAGDLQPGHRLAPIRTLARELELSPTTISAAWSLLQRSGVIVTDGRRGTVVAEATAPGPRRYRRALERATAFVTDLSTGLPDPALLPDLGPGLSRLPAALSPSSYLDPPVVPALEELLRTEWPGPVESLTMVDGAMDAVDQVAGALTGFGRRVAVETPGFPPLLDLLDALGAEVVGIELDEQGPVAGSVRDALDAQVELIFFQPRAQNPTGVSLTEDRADELAAAVLGSDVVVVENDSIGAVASSPLVSLAARVPSQVLHIRSFSKSHGPDLRLAALGGPAALVEPIVQRRYLGQGWSSRLLQHLLVDLLTDTASTAQVARARQAYTDRRRAVAGVLDGAGVAPGGGDGLNLWVPVADEQAALIHLASRGIGVAAGSPFMVGESGGPFIRATVGIVHQDHRRIGEVLAEAAAVNRWDARS
jgi:DNA-binding transcriptional MocR family regulator